MQNQDSTVVDGGGDSKPPAIPQIFVTGYEPPAYSVLDEKETVIPIGDQPDAKKKKKPRDGTQPPKKARAPRQPGLAARPKSPKRRTPSASGGSERNRRCTFFGFYDTPSRRSLTTILLSWVVLVCIGFLVSVATFKIVKRGCNRAMCTDNYFQQDIYAGDAADQELIRIHMPSKEDRTEECVFQRMVSQSKYPFIEVVHDIGSGWSALVEQKRGRMRCLLFDMRHYLQSWPDTCPSNYPSSLDERVGVPADKSQVSLHYPHRFTRHRFQREVMSETLEPGFVIRKLCSKAITHRALSVESKSANVLGCAVSQQEMDAMMLEEFPMYNVLRSMAVSRPTCSVVYMYESPVFIKEIMKDSNKLANHEQELLSEKKTTVATEADGETKRSVLNKHQAKQHTVRSTSTKMVTTAKIDQRSTNGDKSKEEMNRKQFDASTDQEISGGKTEFTPPAEQAKRFKKRAATEMLIVGDHDYQTSKGPVVDPKSNVGSKESKLSDTNDQKNEPKTTLATVPGSDASDLQERVEPMQEALKKVSTTSDKMTARPIVSENVVTSPRTAEHFFGKLRSESVRSETRRYIMYGGQVIRVCKLRYLP